MIEPLPAMGSARAKPIAMQPYFALSLASRTYVATVVGTGSFILGSALYVLSTEPIGTQWLLLAALTLLSGSFTIKVPSIPATISVSETFVLIILVLFGPQPAIVTVALEGLIISLWIQRRKHETYRIFFNMAAPVVSIWVAWQLSFRAFEVAPLAQNPVGTTAILPALAVFTLLFFLLNSWLVTLAVAFERPTESILSIWRNNFLWLSLNYFGGASVAVLLVQYTRDINLAAVGLIIPLIVIAYFTFKMSMGRIEDANQHLSQMNSLYLSTIETLAMAVDAKDQITHGHIRRVQAYAVGMARAIGIKDEKRIRAVEAASLLHDMGKLAVPEYILNKPGRLTEAEFDKMKTHASVGADILSSIDFPYPVAPIVRHHHENWDGTGYPDGLAGSEIPLEARLLSVVDCFDALTSDRPYRPRLSDTQALEVLRNRRGSMYDPTVVDLFVRIHKELASTDDFTSATAEAFSAISESVVPMSYARSVLPVEETSTSRETRIIDELARALSDELNLAGCGVVLVEHLRRLLPVDLCALYIYDAVTDELIVKYATGTHSEAIKGARLDLGQKLSGWVGANRQTILNSDPVLDIGEVARTSQPHLHSCLSTPVLLGDTLVGVMTLYACQNDAYAEDHRRAAEAIVKIVARPLKNSLTR